MLLGACHHDPAPATPADPSDKPPLPPASGTPIGFLIDDAGDLHLRDDQVAKLREIDTSLAAQLEVIDSQTRAANKPAEEAASPTSSGGGRHGGRHGGMGGGGMGGSPGGGGHHKRGGGGAGSGAPSNSAMVGKLVDERTADVKDALERAFALLDPRSRPARRRCSPITTSMSTSTSVHPCCRRPSRSYSADCSSGAWFVASGWDA